MNLNIKYPPNNCKLCPLHHCRSRIVEGDGNINAAIAFVGEAPGADEDEQGVPFIGKTGQHLRKLIQESGITDFYITNINKCRPPGNRTPTKEEGRMCAETYLRDELETLNPKIIVALGKHAAKILCGYSIPVTKMRGQIKTTTYGKVLLTLHPSYLIRNHGKFDLDVVNDLKKALIESER